MAYNILFTSLCNSGLSRLTRYYYAKEGEEKKYTDVMFTAEAATKQFLSSVHIDEIFVLGRNVAWDEGDDKTAYSIADGKSFYDTDLSRLSTYSMFRYRLAQFRDDLNLDQEIINKSLPEEKQKELEDFIRKFYEAHPEESNNGKYNRFFDRLVNDAELYNALLNEIFTKIPFAAERESTYLKWIKNYLYMQLRDYSKLSILRENEDAKIRFFPMNDNENEENSVDVLLSLADKFTEDGTGDINLYVAMNNDDMTDNFIMFGVLYILDMFNGDDIDIEGVYTPSDANHHLAGSIRESTANYSVSNLITAVNTFLKYGKADMIVDLYEQSNSRNEQLEQMVYAMKRIDTGLSLCYISDIEKGIDSLRELFKQKLNLHSTDLAGRMYLLLSQGISRDYGELVTSDDSGFIELIRWAYSNGFYQACLTLIESKAPADIVGRGILYYCNDESQKEHVTELFARKRVQMRSHEYYKMNDIEHYFIKNYFYFKNSSNTLERQRQNAKTQVESLDNTNPDCITGYTVCDDRQLLEDLFFAYLRIGNIRNKTNHAEDVPEEEDTLYPDNKSVSPRLKQITEVISYFIETYEKILENVKDKKPNVVYVTPGDIKRVASKLEDEMRKERNSAKKNTTEE